MENFPFYTRFSTASRYYLYDAVTQNFLQTDPIVFDIVGFFIEYGGAETAKKFKGKYPPDKIKRALALIKKALAESMLLSPPVEQFCSFGTRKEIVHALESHCQQLILEVTQDCNMRCKYCVYSGMHRDSRAHAHRHMPPEISQKAINFYIEHSGSEKELFITFYGGEPLLRMEAIKDVVIRVGKSAKNKKARFNLTTNGILLTMDRIDFLARNDFGVMVSLDGPAEIHNRYRVFPKGAGTQKLIVENLVRIKKKYPEYFDKRISLSTVLAPPIDFRALYEFFDTPLLREVRFSLSGVDDPDGKFSELYTACPGKEDNFSWLETTYKQIILRRQKPNGFLKGMFEADLARIHNRIMYKKLLSPFHLNGICLPGRRRLFVDAGGVFHTCERINGNMPIGNIHDGFDISRIMSYINKYRQISVKDCRSCWAVRFCSLCFHDALGTELRRENKLKHCGDTQALWKQMFSLYCSICEEDPKALSFLKNITFS